MDACRVSGRGGDFRTTAFPEQYEDGVYNFGVVRAVLVRTPAGMVGSILARRCNRNVLLNACYSNWPHERLEVMLAETGLTPSATFLRYARTPMADAGGLGSSSLGPYKQPVHVFPAQAYEGSFCGGIRLRYFFFDGRNFEKGRGQSLQTSILVEAQRPMIGKLRNFLISKAVGEVAINMDNDDVYSPNYVRRIVRLGVEGRSVARGDLEHNETQTVAVVSVQETALATVLPSGLVSIEMKADAHRIASNIWRRLKFGEPCRDKKGTPRDCTDWTECVESLRCGRSPLSQVSFGHHDGRYEGLRVRHQRHE